MEKRRKIAMVVRKSSFDELEEQDNQFYASLSPEQRLEILVDLRKTMYGNFRGGFQKVVSKRYIHEEAGE
jgi:hypothetical protein